MTPIARIEEWIAPRALPILALIAVLVIGAGISGYLIRKGDLNRVEKIERIIRCEDSLECRRFIYRAIRELLEHARRERSSARPGPNASPKLRRPDQPSPGSETNEGTSRSPKSSKPPSDAEPTHADPNRDPPVKSPQADPETSPTTPAALNPPPPEAETESPAILAPAIETVCEGVRPLLPLC